EFPCDPTAPAPKFPECSIQLDPDIASGQCLLFLHRRTAANGMSRGVAIVGQIISEPTPTGTKDWVVACQAVILYTGDWRGPHATVHAEYLEFPFPLTAHNFMFYGGQADPKDASHFTIRYSVDGVEGTIDGWLIADDELAGV